MSLRDWVADGSVKRLAPKRGEIRSLLAVADRDLADANVRGLSADRRFATAYAAALQLATVALRARGYRTSGSSAGHHFKTIALLPESMGPDQKKRARYLDACRKLRNQADYDRVNVVSERDLQELLKDTLAFRNDVLDWLAREHPELT